MSIGFLFWLLMVLWLFYGFFYNADPARFGAYGWIGNSLLLFVLFFLLGWKVFGFVIQG